MNYDLSKYELEQFSPIKAEQGHPTCTREGHSVEHISTLDADRTMKFQISSSNVPSWHFKNGKPIGVDKDESNKYDLFHPILKPKTKRIPFDASRVNEEGVKVVCRDSEHWKFSRIICDNLKSERPLVVALKWFEHSWETCQELYPNGRKSAYPGIESDSTVDILLEVPDNEPALPSMQEVAEKVKAECLWSCKSGVIQYNRDGAEPYGSVEADVERLKAITLLMNVARFANDGWDTKNEAYHFENFMDGVVIVPLTGDLAGQILFKSEEAANYACEILNSWEPNDAILLRALGVK